MLFTYRLATAAAAGAIVLGLVLVSLVFGGNVAPISWLSGALALGAVLCCIVLSRMRTLAAKFRYVDYVHSKIA